MTVVATKIIEPRVLVETAWINRWQMDPDFTIPLPANKAFGISDTMQGVPFEQILNKVTHLQKREGRIGLSNDHLWVNLRGENVTISNVVDSVPENLKYLVMAQLAEDGFSWAQVDQVFQQAYQKLQTAFGVTSPSQTGLIGDYWSGLGGYSIEARFPKTKYPNNPTLTTIYSRLRAGMASQGAARKRWNGAGHEQNWMAEDAKYFSEGAYLHRNWYVNGYLNSLKQTAEGQRFYETAYNFERCYLAIADRKTGLFAWDSLEGADSTPMTVSGDFPKLKFTEGSIMRNALPQAPHALMKEEAFLALLLGDFYIMWGIFEEYSAELSKWFVSRHGGYANWKTVFEPNGGGQVNYDNTNPAHPAMLGTPGDEGAPGTIFPEVPRTGLQGAACGAYLYSQLAPYANQSVEYPPFTYSLNASQVGGYYNGAAPVVGSQGNARVSAFGYANYGQDNIVRSAEAEKPVCYLTRGTQGKGVVWKNCFAKIGEQQTILVDDGQGGTIECNATGPGLQTFRLPTQS